MIIIAVGWQVYHLTGRVLDLGFVGLSQFLPFLCLSLFAGHAADRFDRRAIILSCLTVYLICALLLFAFARRGNGSVLPIFAVLAILGIARAFMMPASQSFLPNIVPLEILGNAVAINSTAFQLATIVGPSLGGLIYAYGEFSTSASGGARWVYGGAAGLLAAAISLLLFVDGRRVAIGNLDQFSWSHLLEGLRFTWQRKTVLGPFPWTFLRYCSGVLRPSCPPLPGRFCIRDPRYSGTCARHPAWAPWRWRSGSQFGRFGEMWGFICSAASPCSG